MYDQEELNEASLAQLGAILLDTVDGAIERGEVEEIEEAYRSMGQEILRRVPDPAKLEVLMDFHYDKWKKEQKKPTTSRQDEMDACNAFYEFRVLMTGFTECHHEETDEEVESD